MATTRSIVNLLVTGAVGAVVALTSSCTTSVSSSSVYFGSTTPPKGQVMRYISGSEPETLDPLMTSGQPEARVIFAFFEGLIEYHPKTGEPIPALAERWEINPESTQLVFHLRKNAKWSNGRGIKASDFVYSLRRGLDPVLASRNGYLAYDVKYAQGYNEAGVFAYRSKTGEYLLEDKTFAKATESSISGPPRMVFPGDEADRAELIQKDSALKSLLSDVEYVQVKAEDIGIEAVDDYTVKYTMNKSAPYFLGLLAHQYFRLVPKEAIDAHGIHWIEPGNIVTCGAFKLAEWKPYNKIVGVRDPNYWDAANVKLERVEFYPMEVSHSMYNLYKAGDVDAVYNHTVPVGWLRSVRKLKDYMDAPENATSYYMFNTTKPPFNDIRVRRAFNSAIDKDTLAKLRVVYKPLTGFTPEGVFPGYPSPQGDPFDPEGARRLLSEAGYKDGSGAYDPSKFPLDQVELTYNTSEDNKQVAEYVQAQWKQNLRLTVPIKNMEWKTFLDYRAKLQYKGVARTGWVGDYLDPFTFLSLFYTEGGENGTGWFDPKYVKMLDDANRELDKQKRYDMLAKAEKYMLDHQPIIPLLTNATNFMKKPYVKGLYPNPLTLHPWKYVYIEHDPNKWNEQ